MAKQDYEVIRPWAGVSLGEIVKLDPEKIHPAIVANVRKVGAVKAGKAAATSAEADKLIEAATAQAKQLLAEARTEAEAAAKVITDEADKVLAEARTEAERVVGEAYAEAEKIKEAAAGKK